MGLLAWHCTELEEDSNVSEVWNTHTCTHSNVILLKINILINFKVTFSVGFIQSRKYIKENTHLLFIFTQEKLKIVLKFSKTNSKRGEFLNLCKTTGPKTCSIDFRLRWQYISAVAFCFYKESMNAHLCLKAYIKHNNVQSCMQYVCCFLFTVCLDVIPTFFCLGACHHITNS